MWKKIRLEDLEHDTDVSVGARRGRNNFKYGFMGKIIDWDELLTQILINDYHFVEVGLKEDWFWTGGNLISDKQITLDKVWVYSQWATPVVRVDDEVYECWKIANNQPYGDSIPTEIISSLLKTNYDLNYDDDLMCMNDRQVAIVGKKLCELTDILNDRDSLKKLISYTESILKKCKDDEEGYCFFKTLKI